MSKWKVCFGIVVHCWTAISSCLAAVDKSPLTPRFALETPQANCPNMVPHIFENSAPQEEAQSGTIIKFNIVDSETGLDLRNCISACCENKNQSCNVVFVFRQTCYHIRCNSNEACLPKERPGIKDRLQMVLVNPVTAFPNEETSLENSGHVKWLDVLKNEKTKNLLPKSIMEDPETSLNFWNQPHKFRYPSTVQESTTYEDEELPSTEKRINKYLMSSLNNGDNVSPPELLFYNGVSPLDAHKYICRHDVLDITSNSCPAKEICTPIRNNPTKGVCTCRRGYTRNHQGECIPQDLDYAGENLVETILNGGEQMHSSLVDPVNAVAPAVTERQMEQSAAQVVSPQDPSLKKLIVSVVSKEVRLPEKEVTLAAFTVPDEQSSDTKYKYLWTLISQPKGPMNGTISDQSKSKVKLSNLSEGLYKFKVSVTGNGTYGEAMANVTVLPEKRINRIPQVVIKPREQKIRQPTTNAVLDGSMSTDDDKIVSWHWEVISGPIGYQPKLPEVNTLRLTDLKSPGNYTFKLTVTDSDNETNSTIANITVLKITDYPPVANAGEAVILYLPHNNVTLNGTASTDDHEIVAWEWTKDASVEAKAVDMQNTRTPYVELSNLEEGMYTFVLKVTDGSGQSSTANVHVFVKPPTNSPPVAKTAGNKTINLPRNWILLNGSQSTDDIRIESYFWRQKSGPNTAIIVNSNASIANATSLTLGLYEFILTISDETNNTASDDMWVKVVQEKNSPPVANGGGDQSLTLPVSAIYFNGSKSSDDLAIVSYKWTRDGASLATGNIVGNTDKEPILILTNVVHGRYVFQLTVIDDQGLTNTDTVSVIVHPDPLLMNLVEMTFSMGITILTKSELDSLVQKIALLLGDMKIHVRELKFDAKSEEAVLVFYVESIGANGKLFVLDGLRVEQMLKEKFWRDASILGTVFADVRTTVCQNKCSGHGECNTVTRACMCETFWMPSAFYFWGIEEANCDWSILYVIVVVIIGFLMLSGIFWGISFSCRQRKKPRIRPKLQKYSLIGAQDEEAPSFNRTSSLTDSETDSDVLFETRSKPNGILRSNGLPAKKNHQGQQQQAYAVTKLGRKIKT